MIMKNELKHIKNFKIGLTSIIQSLFYMNS